MLEEVGEAKAYQAPNHYDMCLASAGIRAGRSDAIVGRAVPFLPEAALDPTPRRSRRSMSY